MLIALVQAALFLWQLKMIRRSLADTKMAADAAQQAAQATQASVALAKDTAERQLRAYLSRNGKEPHSELPDAEGTLFEFRLRFRNNGQTPAYDVRVTHGTAVLSVPLPQNVEIRPAPTPTASKGPLGPGATFTIALRSPVLSPQEIAEVKDGSKKRLFLAGRITYRDAFDHERYVQFLEGIRWLSSGEYESHTAETGNESN